MPRNPLRPPGTLTGVGPALRGGGPAIAPDPALASWANFNVQVESEFNGGPGEGFNGYDRQRHRFKAGYIKPSRYRLSFDARLGMDLNRPRPLAMVNLGLGPPARTIDDFLDIVDSPDEPGPGGGGGGGGGPIVPERVIAFTWTVDRTDGSFRNSQLIMRPISPMQQATFDVPSVGTYDVTLRVTFRDGTSGERTVQIDLRDWFIVSIGDSAASGQGNPDLPASLDIGGGTVCRFTTLAALFGATPNTDTDARWIEPKAYRSMRSGPALAALAVQSRGGGTVDANRQPVNSVRLDKVVFASFARSGAEVSAGLIRSQGSGSDFIGAGQIEELRRTARGRPVDALMISIGGNDAGFSGVITDLVSKDSVFKAQLPFLGTGNDAAERQRINDRLDQILGVGLPPGQKGDLENAYDSLRDQIERLRKDIGVRDVYWTGYPTALFENRTDGGRLTFKSCGVFSGPDLDIDAGDFQTIRTRGQTLNALIKRKAGEFGWQYIDVEADFRGHGYCESSDETYWVGMEQSCRTQGDFQGTLHPNFRGHAAYALRLSNAIRLRTVQPLMPAAPLAPVVPPVSR